MIEYVLAKCAVDMIAKGIKELFNDEDAAEVFENVYSKRSRTVYIDDLTGQEVDPYSVKDDEYDVVSVKRVRVKRK